MRRVRRTLSESVREIVSKYTSSGVVAGWKMSANGLHRSRVAVTRFRRTLGKSVRERHWGGNVGKRTPSDPMESGCSECRKFVFEIIWGTRAECVLIYFGFVGAWEVTSCL